MTNYIIASSKPWFSEHKKSELFNKFNFVEISKRDELNLDLLAQINPRFIFFPHWNWKVDSNILSKYECVAFHTAPLPFGRGGSPIQNLIVSGFTHSPVCALKMTDIIDGGPIYSYLVVSLDGSICDIFLRIAECVEKLITYICENEPSPTPQTGKVFNFKRLSEVDNELHYSFSLNELYNRIRMVDGLDYPRAYIIFGKYKIEFTNATMHGNIINASVKIINGT